MPLVMKFGGTSNQDAAAMRNVVRIVAQHRERQPVVVISAIARATNELEAIARSAAGGRAEDAEEKLRALLARHEAILDELVSSAHSREEIRATFRQYAEAIRRLITGVSIVQELTPRMNDAFSAYGERFSSRLVAAALGEAGIDAAWVDAGRFMVTDDEFGRARPLMEMVSQRLAEQVLPLVNKNVVPVTQGFIGVTRSGVSTTMGRESSDYSASIVGACLPANEVQIWTDVNGILTADPRLVSGVYTIPRMSFEEAFELSSYGAKVLHPNTMVPVLDRGIPVRILNSRNATHPGTLIDVHSDERQEPRVLSIAYRTDLWLVRTRPAARGDRSLFWQNVISILLRHGVEAGAFMTSEEHVAFTVDASEENAAALREDLATYGGAEMLARQARLCLVGRRLRDIAGLLDRVAGALTGIRVHGMTFGASPRSLCIVVDNAELGPALNNLHAEFFAGQEGTAA